MGSSSSTSPGQRPRPRARCHRRGARRPRRGVGRIEDLLRTALLDRRALLLWTTSSRSSTRRRRSVRCCQERAARKSPCDEPHPAPRVGRARDGDRAARCARPRARIHDRGRCREPIGRPVRLECPRGQARLELTPQNIEDVRRICVALDGVPLAMSSPRACEGAHAADLLGRLHRRLAVLAGGAATCRSASARCGRPSMVGPAAPVHRPRAAHPARRLRVLVLAGRRRGHRRRRRRREVLADLGTLVDGSLVRQQDRGDRARFMMLSTVHEYIQAELDARTDARVIRDRHASWVVASRRSRRSSSRGPIRDAASSSSPKTSRTCVAASGICSTPASGISPQLRVVAVRLLVADGHAEVRIWMEEMLDAGEPIEARSRAIALYFRGTIGYWRGDRHRRRPRPHRGRRTLP